jgi:hypothetical protein
VHQVPHAHQHNSAVVLLDSVDRVDRSRTGVT